MTDVSRTPSVMPGVIRATVGDRTYFHSRAGGKAMGCMAARFDRNAAIRELETHGVDTDEAIGIVNVLEGRVLPHCASKHGEASARGRLTARINQAFTDLSDVRQRLTRVEETMATRQDLADLRYNLVMTFGGMLAAAVAFLTVVQGFLN